MQQMKGNSLKYVPGQGPTVPQQCPQTGSGFLVGGPFWAEPLHDMDFARSLLQAIEVRIWPIGQVNYDSNMHYGFLGSGRSSVS